MEGKTTKKKLGEGRKGDGLSSPLFTSSFPNATCPYLLLPAPRTRVRDGRSGFLPLSHKRTGGGGGSFCPRQKVEGKEKSDRMNSRQ